MKSPRQVIEEIQTHYAALRHAANDCQHWHTARVAELETEYKRQAVEIEAKHQAAKERAEAEYDRAAGATERTLAQLSTELGLVAADWDDPCWRGYQPALEAAVPQMTRLGALTLLGTLNTLEAPALWQFLNQGHLLLLAGGAAKEGALQALQSVMLRLLATFPPGKLRFVLLDPVGLGANVAGFVQLPEQVIVGKKAWTEPRHIERQLADLSAHMENVIQKYLLNRYPTMEDYNAQAGEVAEAYRFLVVANFPVNFSDAAARRLVSIAANGPKTGVYVLATVDTDQKLSHGFNLDDLKRTATVIEAEADERFVWHAPDFERHALKLDAPPSTEQFNRIVAPIGAAAAVADRVQVPFEKVAPPEPAWQRADSRSGLRAPIGRYGAREIQYLDLGQGAAHYALLAGKPGSGKSTLLHVLISSLALTYPPEELELYLVDFKQGVEFKDYAEYELPHARVVAIESEREFGLSVLQKIEAELDRRGELFRRANNQSIEDYRDRYLDARGERLPRILLIVDEFQRLFSEDDALAMEAARILAHITQQSRAFGIHVLLASQSLADAFVVGRATYDKMNVRIALHCSDADSRLILGEDNAAARLLRRPGEAVYNDANGRVEGNTIFQVAWLPDDERETLLKRIRALADQADYRPPAPQIVFEGNAPTHLTDNRELAGLLNSPLPRAGEGSGVRAWLGESVAIKPHTAARFRRQSRANLLILGQNEVAAYAMLASGLISLCAHLVPQAARFFVADVAAVEQPWTDTLQDLSEAMPHEFEVVGRRGVRDVIETVGALVDERLADEPTNAPLAYLILGGLQRIRELREADKYGDPRRLPQRLAHIVREGPDLGVHTILWCDTWSNLTRVFQRRDLVEFDLRVALQMSQDDSNNLLDSPQASKLGPHRAYFYDEEQVGKLEKFRPYGLAKAEQMREIGAQLRERGEI